MLRTVLGSSRCACVVKRSTWSPSVPGYDWSNGIYRANVLVAGPRHALRRIFARARSVRCPRATRRRHIDAHPSVRAFEDAGADRARTRARHGRGLIRSEVGTTFVWIGLRTILGHARDSCGRAWGVRARGVKGGGLRRAWRWRTRVRMRLGGWG